MGTVVAMLLICGILGILAFVWREPLLTMAHPLLARVAKPLRGVRSFLWWIVGLLASLGSRIRLPFRPGRAVPRFFADGITDNLYFAPQENGGRRPALLRSERRLLAAAILIGVAAVATVSALDDALARMRVVGQLGHDSASVVGGDSAEMRSAISGWYSWFNVVDGRADSEATDPGRVFVAPKTVARWALGGRVVQLLSLVVVLGYAITAVRRRVSPDWALSPEGVRRERKRARLAIQTHNVAIEEAQRLGPPRDDGTPAAENTVYRQQRDRQCNPVEALAGRSVSARIDEVSAAAHRSASWGQLAILLFVVMIGVEAVALGFAFRRLGAGVGWESMHVLHATYKYLFGVVVVLVAGLFLLAPVPDRLVGPLHPEGVRSRVRRFLLGLVALRMGFVVTGIAGVFMFVMFLGDQFADVLRRWGPQQAVAAIMLAIVLAAAVFLSSVRVAGRVWSDVDRFVFRRPARRALRQLVALGIVVLGAVALMVRLSGGTLGSGLLIPAGFVVLIGLVPDRPGVLQRVGSGAFSRVIPKALPRLLTLAVPVMLGVALLRAAAADWFMRVDFRGIGWLALPVAVAIVGAFLVGRRRGGPEGRRILVIAAVVWSATVIGAMVWILGGPAHPLRLEPGAALSEGILLALGLTLLALAYPAFYFLSGIDRADTGVCPVCGYFHAVPGRVSRKGGQPIAVVRGRDVPVGVVDLGRGRPWFVGLHIIGLLALAALVVDRPLEMGPKLGTAAAVFLAIAIIAIVAEGALRFAEQSDAPPLVRSLGLNRTPVFLLLLLWGVIANALVPARHFHEVEIVRSAGTPTVGETWGVTVDEVWERWRSTNVDVFEPPTRDDGRRPAIPIVFVSAWGGGIRAAVWTALVLDCAFEPHPTVGVCRGSGERAQQSVAVFSGVSGGSLGMAEYVAYLASSGELAHDWVARRLGGDFLAPTMSRMLLVDLPLHFAGSSGEIDDRADVLASAWEEAWHDAEPVHGMSGNPLMLGLLETWEADSLGIPFFVLNGSIVGENCGFNGSVLDGHVAASSPKPDQQQGGGELDPDDCAILAPYLHGPGSPRGVLAATRDLADFLCPGDDIRLSDSALLSARFQYVSPAGWLQENMACEYSDADEDALFLRDGGNHEPSGAGTALQMWEALEPRIAEINATLADRCVVPVMIHIENGFKAEQSDPDPRTPDEFINPTLEVINRYVGLADLVRARAAYAFGWEQLQGADGDSIGVTHPRSKSDSQPGQASRYVFIRTRAHPGAQAPLGWTLSPQTIEDLEDQLDHNSQEFEIVKTWFDGDMSCDPLPDGVQPGSGDAGD